jgi:hypothetical protein
MHRSIARRGVLALPTLALRRRVVLLTIASTALMGCGSDADKSRPDPRPASPVPVDSQSLLQADRPPPPGVAEQVDYFQEGGPVDCDRVPGEVPEVRLGRGVLTEDLATREDLPVDRPQLGETLAICSVGFDEEAPLELTVRHESRTIRSKTVAAMEQWDLDLEPGMPLGSYEVNARQGAVSASTRFELTRATEPAYRVPFAPPTSREARVLLVGFKPGQRVTLSFYRTPGATGATPDDRGALQAQHLASTQVQVGGDGSKVFVHRRHPKDPGGCYLVKVRVGDATLDDLHNTLSVFCWD